MIYNQIFTDIEISIKEIHSNNPKLHKHHYFELIYVMEGTGIHNINHNHYNFSQGDVFLLTPDDAHTFLVDTPTKFCIVDFTKSFFSRNAFRSDDKMELTEFFKRLEYVFHNHHPMSGNIISSDDRELFGVLVERLVLENQNYRTYSEIITQNIVFLLLHLVARQIQQENYLHITKINPKSKVHDIIAYVQQHIYDKELLKIENLGSIFHKSADHLNRYFKIETGATIKDYITKYKMSLVRTRLRFSELTISEIAHELSYTDESHLNKIFRNQFGKTAKQYRSEYTKKSSSANQKKTLPIIGQLDN